MLMNTNLTALIFYGTMGNSFRICMAFIIWYRLEICICSPNESFKKMKAKVKKIQKIFLIYAFTLCLQGMHTC